MIYNRIEEVSSQIKFFFRDSKYKQVREVIWFIVITAVIHFSYRFWAMHFQYWPIQAWMGSIRNFMAATVFEQSTWVNQHILGLNLTRTDHVMYFSNGSGIAINDSCSGDKQILQFALLLLIFPGSRKRKLWFIPMGMIFIHITNIIRVALMSLVSVWQPEWTKPVHDNVLRGFFYIVIFGLWLWFVKANRK